MKTLSTAAALALAAGFALGGTQGALAKDYLLTGVKPDKLVVVDAAARQVHKVHTIPQAAPGPVTITPSPDGKTAYVIVNRWESVSGIDLESGEEVFRAELSSERERAKVMFGMDISPDGKTLAVYESPVKLHLGEYEVQPTRISFFDTGAGKGAQRLRSIPAPRQITILMYSKDGSRLYGLGRAVHVIDPATGDVITEHKTQGWDRAEFYPPDILSVWSQWEQAGVFSTPYYTARSDMSLEDPAAYWTGLLTLDLDSGAFKLKEVENTDIFYFSTVVSPTNPDLLYGVYNNLSKLDAAQGKPLGRVELDHSYYAVNISSDGKEVYIGGTMSDIAVYDAETLKKLGNIEMPGGANQALATLRVIRR